ncbi:MAG: molybdopterin-dependent oxidoreductase [Gammaproteobacteria bacterium]|nr:molybdopterin-dependent oxidoreductase [Gammaproteobacteria bacterium]
MRVHLEDGRVAAIHGDPEHPMSQGYVCPKATDAAEIVYHPQRVHTPLKRIGARGAGQWQTISWDAAIAEIAERIAGITTAHGAESLAYSYGTFRGGDWGIGERFLNRHGSPNSCGQDKVCYGTLTLAESLTYGFGPTVFAWPVPAVTRCVVLWGMRPIASAPLLWRAISRAHRAGARLIVIDPLRTQEAQRADTWLAPLPGSDTALALGLLKVLVERDWHDADFVRQHCTGFDELAAQLASHSLDALAAQCGLDVDSIVNVAQAIAGPGPTVINAGNGLCQSGTPAMHTARAVANLIALSGNLGRSGGHALAGPPRDIRANGLMLDADQLPRAQHAKRLGGDRFPFLGHGYFDVDDAIASAWHGHRHALSWIATAHEPSLWRAISDAEPYAVKALVVQHHNPLGANANAAAAARALMSENLELLVVQDLFHTPTSVLADYLLPAAHWLEKPYFSLGIAFVAPAGDFVAANHAALATTDEHHSDYDLWRDLARHLGQAEAWPDSAEDFYSHCLAPAALDFAQVAARRMLVGADARHPDHADALTPTRYGTPSGKVELASTLLAQWGQAAVPLNIRPALFDDAQAYPLILTSGGRVLEGFHENAQHSARFRRKRPHPCALLHPDTAAAAGIAAGAWFEIHTAMGHVRHIAEISHKVARGVVQAERWWYPEGTADRADPFGLWATNINVCTADDDANVDAVMGAWLLRGLPCRIAPVADQERATP